jgi:hypothetical protein
MRSARELDAMPAREGCRSAFGVRRSAFGVDYHNTRTAPTAAEPRLRVAVSVDEMGPSHAVDCTDALRQLRCAGAIPAHRRERADQASGGFFKFGSCPRGKRKSRQRAQARAPK